MRIVSALLVSGVLEGAVVVCGRYKATGKIFVLSTSILRNLREKQLLWDRLSLVVGQREDVNTYVIGDFNTIIEEGEIGVGRDRFGERNEGVLGVFEQEQPDRRGLQGRKFMWYDRGGGVRAE